MNLGVGLPSLGRASRNSASTRNSVFTQWCKPLVAAPTSQLAQDLPLRGGDGTIPRLVYGTAWKAERTADLVYMALKTGFRGIDTAAQPRHYREDLVGEGIRRAVLEGIVSRKDLYIQTKFTPLNGQDPHQLPYDPSAAVPDQVRASVASSLRHLATSDAEEEPYLDTVVLHSPFDDDADTLAAWRTLESYVPHRIRQLGISNAPLPIVASLLDPSPSAGVRVRPAVVQNRFHKATAWEIPLRALCRRNGVVFQSFWTLTGNPRLVRHRVVTQLAEAAGVSNEVALYALVLGLEGTAVLDGTKDAGHMRADLEGLEKVGLWAASGDGGEQSWEACLAEFKTLIGEV